MATFKTLSSSLNWPSGLGKPGTTTLVSSTGLGTDTITLVPHFLNSSLESQQSFTLLSFHQTYNHYLHIMRKMGVNLAAKNKIKFVNGLTHQQLDNLPPQTRPDYTLINTTQEWHLFFEWLENTQPQVLLIDGLCSLLDMGVSVDAATWFFECCQRIVERAGGRLVVAMYLDEFSEPLARRIVRLAHYVLSMQELLSGASSDVSGQLTAVPGHLYSQVHDARSEFKPISLHYRVSDTTVQFFSPGQSHTVL